MSLRGRALRAGRAVSGRRQLLLPIAALSLLAVAHPASSQFTTSEAASRVLVPPAGGDADERRAAEREMLDRAQAERSRSGRPPQNRGQDTVEVAPDGADLDAEAIREAAIAAEVARRIEAAEREAELDHLSQIIRRRTADRGPWLPEKPGLDLPAPSGPMAEGPEPPAVSAVPVRATVLLELRPGRQGILRLARTADPILCTSEVCWVSRGPDRDARQLPRRVAFGPFNTLGSRAGACNDSTGCVFRNVQLETGILIQPVDLRLVRHDRREARRAQVDKTCRAERGTLRCQGLQSGPDYHLLVVPEAVAEQAGGRVLRSLVGTLRR
jgi:hypothetical protein